MFTRKIEKEEKKWKTFFVVSYGGSGSNMLNDFLHHKLGYTSYHIHRRYPWPTAEPTSRVIFIYANPVDVVISLFKRFPPSHLYHNLECSKHGPRTLEDYVNAGKDALELESYFFNYLYPVKPISYPVVFIRYEAIWKNLPLFAKTIGTESKAMDTFPPKLTRSDYHVKPEIIVKLKKIYENLISTQARLPDIFIQ